ncbi:hypothetical protein QQS21_009147 [Conoideocrella luteorostrata]|uniref:Zn(2)-C6 fungal-type domain-containing protein n=1 Tax=Conoideocrella luteorostrata TaxID=1105319 RepID=A0AAJ0CK67_9HYPO|nr:hypothetical protein QQS21_009147 [Conoideocrella luteorostrata]
MDLPDNAAQESADQSGLRQSRTNRRSRNGCQECRRQKIKCDERQPRCGQCVKRNRECHVREFVLKQHAFSLDNPPSKVPRWIVNPQDEHLASMTPASTGTLSGVRAHSAFPYDANEPPVMEPHQRAGVPTLASPSYRQQGLPSPIYDRVSVNSLLTEPPPLSNVGPNLSRAGTRTHNANRPNLHGNMVVYRLGNAVSPPAPETANPAKMANSSRDCVTESLKDTQEELFLLRHYSECIAPWMDHIYGHKVFSGEVLLLAREHPILRHAACALSAKQLFLMKNSVSRFLRRKTQEHLATKLLQGGSGVDFAWVGFRYHEKVTKMLHHPTAPIVRLLCVCILVQYEQINANRDAWSAHLNELWKLLNTIDNGMLLELRPQTQHVDLGTEVTMAVMATFWNFIVNDLEESLISFRRTRIDTNNWASWRKMGLDVEDSGLHAQTTPLSRVSAIPERDTVISFALIRLLYKLVDYLAPSTGRDSPLRSTGPRASRLEFVQLEGQFDSWYRKLPPSFRPDGTFAAADPNNPESSGLFTREIWFSSDVCSTTMMYYHMACLLFLFQQPPSLLSGEPLQSPSFDLIRNTCDVDQKLHFHTFEIISIARGTSCDAVMLRAIQPLYIAGRCCKTKGDRKGLVEILRGIQDDLGVTTTYRIEALLAEWGSSYRDLGLEEQLVSGGQMR